MTSINTNNSPATIPFPKSMPFALHGKSLGELSAASAPKAKANEAELREKFTQFVGEAFFGQMLKAMRSTVGKPAYFHGGRAEEAFQGQLDQTMSEQMTKASASKFANPMFERQFPKFAEQPQPSELAQLSQLRRF